MPRTPDSGRAPNHASSIYKGTDGYWHGRVTVGFKDDGSIDRRHISSTSRAVVTRKVRDLERQREQGAITLAGTSWTVTAWLTYWLENIAGPSVRPNTLAGYSVAVNIHLIPGVGKHKLKNLTAEHLEKLYQRMIADGSSPATAHQAHRTIRAALNEAVRRHHLPKNPAQLARAPRLNEFEVVPYTLAEVRRILDTAAQGRNGARWAVALALGLRQGECLGLQWTDIDLDTGKLTVRRQRMRPKYRHGCTDTASCIARQPGYCPHRELIRPEADDTKSRAGRRVIGLPAELVDLLRTHRHQQDDERRAAGDLWVEGGWVFATPTGEPIIPRTDWDHWKRLLRRAGVRESRLHDARHTAATVLLLLGVPERVAMSLMGWSSTSMASRYQHITEGLRRGVADDLGAFLWGHERPPETN
ncbi:MAG: site-specific integrase [Kineosporiaceae bacterium]|nr:site-specific integrase [Kineosporiaceae bacterium]